jgi:rhodanese-related sulfurtransferase
MRNILLAAAFAALLVPCAGCSKGSGEASGKTAETTQEAFGRMTIQDLETKMADAKSGKAALFIYDNNQKAVFDKGHIPGAKWVPSDKVQASDLPADKAATLVFYCANEQCGACHEGASSALKLGYSKVFILPSGIEGWQKAGKATETGQV